jgi:hypothetical protein
MYTSLNSGVMYVRTSVNGKLAHECVVFGTLMPRFSCRGVAKTKSRTIIMQLTLTV